VTARVYAAVSVLCGLAVVLSALIAPDPDAFAVGAGVVGVLLLAAGVVAGLAVVAVAGTIGLIASAAMSFVSSDASFSGGVLVVAPLVWVAFESAMRSLETRPHVASDSATTLSWVGGVVGVVAGTVAIGLVVMTAVASAPTGGLAFRALALVAVAGGAVWIAIANLSWRQRIAAERARERGSLELADRTGRSLPE
jgi:hypothetical protein